jgi:hypothetical protein
MKKMLFASKKSSAPVSSPISNTQHIYMILELLVSSTGINALIQIIYHGCAMQKATKLAFAFITFQKN